MTEGHRSAPDETGRVVLLLPEGEDRRLLARALADTGHDVTVAGDAGGLPATFDCCLVTETTLRGAAAALRERRAAAEPTPLPCLLVSQATGSLGGRSRGSRGRTDPLARLDESLAALVDDAVVPPLRETSLRRRVASLVRTRRLALALSASEERYRSLVELLPEAVLLLREGRVVYANRSAVALLTGRSEADGGRPADDAGLALADASPGPLADRPFEDFVDGPAAAAVARSSLAEATGEFVEVGLRSLDGRPLTAELAAREVRVGDEAFVQAVVRDMTERREREERLRLSRRAMDEAAVGITVTDPSRPGNPLTYVNDEFLRLTGYDRSFALGRNPRFVQCEDTDPETVARVREAVDREESVEVTILNERADGERWWNALEVTPVHDADGALTAYIGFQRDVTEEVRRTNTFEHLHDATERLQRASTPEAVFSVGVEAARDVLGLPLTACWAPAGDAEADRESGTLVPVEATDRAWTVEPGIIPSDDPQYEPFASGQARAVDVAATGSEAPIAVGLFFPLGEHGLLGAASPNTESYPDYVAEAGSVLAGHVTAALDRVDRERDLRRYETVVSAAGDPIYTLDEDGRFTSLNEAMVAFAGRDRESLLGSHVSTLMSEDDVARCRALIRAMLRNDDEARTADVTMWNRDDEPRRCEINIAPLTDADGSFAGTVGVVRDVTERERRRQRLAVLDRVLRHNLRNELNVVEGHAEDLRRLADADADEGVDPSRVATHAEAVNVAAADLLSLSATARSIHRTTNSTVEPRDVVPAVTAGVAEARERHPDATVTLDAPERARARAGAGVDRAVAELIDNAVRHGGDATSGVDVTVRRTTADGHAWVEVEVADDGPGIPESERVPLEGSTETPLSHGSGLGLWLVAWTVRHAGGRVSYRCDDGSVVRMRFHAATDRSGSGSGSDARDA
jgi:PAS domain S-box-containing protein